MENISRKEAFDCAIALSASIANILNEEKEKLYDYALILRKGSLSPIICLKAGEFFNWNNNEYGEKTYAFIPIGHQYIECAILNHCGTNNEYYGRTVSFEKFDANQHPCSWIKETLTKKYIKLSYWGGVLWENNLEYDSAFFSKTHLTWIRAKVDDITIYFPYYTKTERQKIFNNLPSDFYTSMTQQHWED